MTAYQRMKIEELQRTYKHYPNREVEVIGKILNSIHLDKNKDGKPIFYAQLSDYKGENLIGIVNFRGRFLKSKIERTLEKAHEEKSWLLVKGTCFAFNYSMFQGWLYLIYAKELEHFKDIGNLSLTDNLEGKVSLADTGNLSLK